MNIRLKITLLVIVTAASSAIISSAVTGMLAEPVMDNRPTHTTPQYSYDDATPYRYGIQPQHDGEYPLDEEYVMRHAFVSSSRESGNTYGYEDLDERINAMRDFEYVAASIGYNTPEEHDFGWNDFHLGLREIREKSNSPYYRDALEALASAKGNSTKAIQIINEAHPVRLDPKNFNHYNPNYVIVDEGQPKTDRYSTLDNTWNLPDEKIAYTIKGGTVTSMQKDYESNSLILEIDAKETGYINVIFPIGLINSAPQGFDGFTYMVLVDGEEVSFGLPEKDIIHIQFQDGTSEIEILGAYW